MTHLETSPELPPAQRALALALHAQAFNALKLDQLRAAEHPLRRLLLLLPIGSPERAAALTALAFIWARTGRAKESAALELQVGAQVRRLVTGHRPHRIGGQLEPRATRPHSGGAA
ncbi:MAG: hypothetical protein KIT72_06030 [Polyangiaceae bacterium]|nr:hypothetical protein [Polyangiaceae bacterium]MCW5789959.1 hypothetical protein [Polyangiaceae bacterium]